MSGHSKWAQIKRKKAATDAARGRAFTRAIKEITIAARQGGGDPEGNARLRSAILAARAVNMPAANIERAIKRGSGELEGARIEEHLYEGYGPGGVAVLVEVATDNRNRAAGDVRHVFSRYGGNLGEAGSVAYLFAVRGVITVERAAATEDALIETALEAGADDVVAAPDHFEVRAAPAAFEAVREALTVAGVPLASAEITRLASVQVPVSGREAEALLKLLEMLEELEDVQKVYANFSVDDEVLARWSE